MSHEQRTAPHLAPSRLGVPGCTPGTVHLVGAGPGDPGLLTVRGAALLATADLVAYDRLADTAVLDLVPSGAERVRVGKTPGGRSWSQVEINALLVDEARRGRAVVRLKGGDPFVFGRGGEEAIACGLAGVPCEVVSGVTSAVAAPAAAGIPVTHRGVATAVAFVTGHEDPSKPGPQSDLDALARFPGTLVFLMGVGNAPDITARLVAGGRDPSTPAAVVRWGTTDAQELLTSDLAHVASDVAAAGLRPPATLVVGEVVALAPLVRATPRDVAAAGIAVTAA